MNKDEKILQSAEEWIGFYRENIHRFSQDYLHTNLRTFQEINLYEMDNSVNYIYIAARGQGKSYLLAIFCCCRAILYPGTKIVVASKRRGQAINILEKIITELKPNSPELASEIDEKASRMNGTNAVMYFKNGSFIKVVTAGESGRSNRAHILIIDEFRLLDKDVIDTILKRFLASQREPPYSELNFKEKMAQKQREKERNRIMWCSSAYTQDSWAYEKCRDTFNRMISGKHKDFICGLPYQLSVYEHLLREEDVWDEMDEADFSEVKWSMEMEAVFWGAGDGSFFVFDSISKNRRIKYPMLPDEVSSKLGNSQLVRIPSKKSGELRILSADIALMSSRKYFNDATAIFINQLMPTKAGRYTSNIVYADSYEGLRTDDQALIIRKLFDEYQCDYLVIDASGIGLGVVDCLMRDMPDPDTGEIYPAISCCNNPDMAARCTVPGAEKVIWAIKANVQLNSDAAFLLREGFKSGRIRLLTMEYEAEEALNAIKAFSSLREEDREQAILPYRHTTLLINEMVNLQHEETGGKIKIFEKSGMRKDRYSSLSYNYYVATQIEAKLSKRNRTADKTVNPFIIKPPSYSGRAVNNSSDRYNNRGWY